MIAGWHRVAGSQPLEDAHVFSEPSLTACDRALAIGERWSVVGDNGTTPLCEECREAIRGACGEREGPGVEACSCRARRWSSNGIERAERSGAA